MQSSVGQAREESEERLCPGGTVESAARSLTLDFPDSPAILSAVLVVLVCFWPVWFIKQTMRPGMCRELTGCHVKTESATAEARWAVRADVWRISTYSTESVLDVHHRCWEVGVPRNLKPFTCSHSGTNGNCSCHRWSYWWPLCQR